MLGLIGTAIYGIKASRDKFIEMRRKKDQGVSCAPHVATAGLVTWLRPMSDRT